MVTRCEWEPNGLQPKGGGFSNSFFFRPAGRKLRTVVDCAESNDGTWWMREPVGEVPSLGL